MFDRVLSDELTFLHFPFLISQMSAEHTLIKYLVIICEININPNLHGLSSWEYSFRPR